MKGRGRVQGGERTARCHLVLGTADERRVVPERATRLETNRNSYLIAYKHAHRDAEVPGENLKQNSYPLSETSQQQLRHTSSDLTSILNEGILGVMITVLDVTWRHTPPHVCFVSECAESRDIACALTCAWQAPRQARNICKSDITATTEVRCHMLGDRDERRVAATCNNEERVAACAGQWANQRVKKRFLLKKTAKLTSIPIEVGAGVEHNRLQLAKHRGHDRHGYDAFGLRASQSLFDG
jgi:hypothetical protein